MIGKLLPRALNKDTDERLIKSYEMVDAVNIQISTDESGDNGVIKNIRSTEAATNTDSYNSGNNLVSDYSKVVGSVEDHENGYVYFFVWNTTNSNHAILKYDVSGNSYTIAAQGSFNFPEYGHVDAAILNDPTHGDNSLIFFTDNNNEPRKINVNRLPDGYVNTQDIVANHEEYIDACIKTPTAPIEYFFLSDYDYYPVNNINKTEGFYFAYRLIYKDGYYSPISVYTEPVIPIGTIESDSSLTDYLNCIRLQIPQYSDEVEKVQILFREGNAGNMYIIEEVEAETDITRTFQDVNRLIWNSGARVYNFFNNGNYTVLPDSEVVKIDEGVPQKAESVSISGERLIYGNYVEGFNNVQPSAVMTVENYDLSDSTYTIPISHHTSETTSLGETSRISFDYSNIPSNIENGSKVSLFFTLTAFPIFSGAYQGPLGFSQYIADYNNIEIFNNGDGINTGDVSVSGELVRLADDVNRRLVIDMGSTEMNFGVSFTLTEDKSKADIIEIVNNLLEGTGIPTGVQNTYAKQTHDAIKPATCEYSVISDSSTGTIEIESAKITFGFRASFSPDTANTGYTEFTIREISDVNVSTPFVSFDDDDFFEEQSTNFLLRDGVTDQRSVYVKTSLGRIYNDGFFTSFKSGCSHDFGVVYYDKKGRRSNVNYIGPCYVPDQGEREKKGVSHVSVELTHTPPSWATEYQIVYGGNQTADKFIQFSIPNIYGMNNAFSGGVDNDTYFYVPLSYLQNTNVSMTEVNGRKADDGTSVLYKYNQGDILKFISSEYNGERQYYSGYDFEIIDVKTFNLEDTPIEISSSSPDMFKTGEFLICKNRTDLNELPSTIGKTIVEIYSPKKKTTFGGIYYETGEVRSISNNSHGGPVVVRYGDCFVRESKMQTNQFDDPNFVIPYSENDDGASYVLNTESFYIESDSFYDASKSKTPNRGRAAFIVDTSKNIRRKSSLTFSERHILANGRNYLTSFNKHDNNRYDLPPRFGAVNKIIDNSEYITCLQERKVSRIPIDRSIISTATGNESLILSTKPLGVSSFYQGDYGSSNNPSAVIKIDGNVFFADKRVGKILKLSNEGISVISDANMSSYFEEKLLPANNITDYYLTAGYDPMNEEVIFTLVDFSNSGLTFTAGYSVSKNFWKSRYSFSPTKYAHMNGRLIGCRNPFLGDGLIYLHEEGDDYGLFYNSAIRADSSMSLIMNYNPSMSKTMQAISIEGTAYWDSEVYTYDNDGTQRTSGVFDSFVEKENTWWGSIPKSRVGYKIPIGTVSGVSGNNVTFSNSILNIAIPSGVITNQNGTIVSNDSSPTIVDENTLFIGGIVNVGDTLYIAPHGDQNGDPIKGQYCHVDLSINTGVPVELYAVNIDFVPSRLDASLGTQAE